MTTDETLDHSLQNSAINLTHVALQHLRSAAKWGKFLAIMGFILSGLMALIGLFSGSILGMMGGALDQGMLGAAPGFLMTIVYLLVAAIYFLPAYFLFVFSQKTLRAIGSSDSNELEQAMNNLKRLYLFMGIVTVIILAFYAIALLIAIVGGLAAM